MVSSMSLFTQCFVTLRPLTDEVMIEAGSLARHPRTLGVCTGHPTDVLVAVVRLGVLDGQGSRFGNTEAAIGGDRRRLTVGPRELWIDELEGLARVHARDVHPARSQHRH